MWRWAFRKGCAPQGRCVATASGFHGGAPPPVAATALAPWPHRPPPGRCTPAVCTAPVAPAPLAAAARWLRRPPARCRPRPRFCTAPLAARQPLLPALNPSGRRWRVQTRALANAAGSSAATAAGQARRARAVGSAAARSQPTGFEDTEMPGADGPAPRPQQHAVRRTQLSQGHQKVMWCTP